MNLIRLNMEFCTDFGDYIIYDDGVSLGYGVDFKETLHDLTHEEAIERVEKLEFKDGKTWEAEEGKRLLLEALRAGETEFDYECNGNREIDIWIMPCEPCVESKPKKDLVTIMRERINNCLHNATVMATNNIPFSHFLGKAEILESCIAESEGKEFDWAYGIIRNNLHFGAVKFKVDGDVLQCRIKYIWEGKEYFSTLEHILKID